ncbi:MAG TPA: FAD-binding oxidoreductase [Casimicrobiaceae bacterium]|nr:FAD-binding oxidoreductase [Casimicrobiaceae bacterium]
MAEDRDLARRLERIVGERGVVTGEADTAPYLTDWRRAFNGRALAVVRPASTDEVSAVVGLCAAEGIPVVPQGGNTGMCGGAIADDSGRSVVVALGRMNRILDVDARNDTATVEAGCVLADLQAAAARERRLFPLSLAAEGSCQIGGNVSTNAGGINVLRYGNTRELTLGLEAVLPDGSVWNGLRSLRKDNTGYDLKQLFIGGEGTLGIVTRVVVKLHPAILERITVLAAVPTVDAAVELLARLREHCGETISAFELVSRRCLELVLQHGPGARDPLTHASAWYVLAEVGDTHGGGGLRDRLEAGLLAASEGAIITDAVIAESMAQRETLWRLREALPEAIRAEGLAFRSDVAVAVGRVPAFVAEAGTDLERAFPGIRIVCFGHLGDGNLHFNALPNRDAALSPDWAREVARVLYDAVRRYDGSISAEHGIGQAKRGELARCKSAIEMTLMRQVKRMLDPNGLMNPGKLL